MNMKNQKEKSVSENETAIEFVELTKENIKADTQTVMAPSVNIIRMIVDVIANEGLRGYVIDDKSMRFGITLVADIDDVLKNEKVYIEKQKEA